MPQERAEETGSSGSYTGDVEAVATAAAQSEQALMGGVFRGSTWDKGAVAFEEEWIDFGMSSRLRLAEGKAVRLLNRTGGKLSVSWVVPDGYSQGSARDRGGAAFAVTPLSIDVLPRSAATFKVQFRPQSDQQYYCQRLECCVSFKSMRTFRLVTDTNFTTPWTLSLCAFGHTFPPNTEQFIARPALSHRVLSFPAAHIGDTAYQSIGIKNEGDTPMMFEVSRDPSGVFVVVPHVGVVPRGQETLLAVRFAPLSVGLYDRTLSITLNSASSAPLPLRLVGLGCRTRLEFANDGRIFCPTTCIDSVSHARMRVRNPWRLPMAFDWAVPERLQSVLSVEPATGVLQGREELELVWAFRPLAERQYLAKVPCLISAIDEGTGNSHEVVKQVATIAGTGSKGSLRAEPSTLDFGSVLVGEKETLPLSIVNSSAVDLYYSLTFEQLEGAAARDDARPLIRCTKPEGVVPARNTVDLFVVCSAQTRGKLRFATHCTLRPGASTGPGQAADALTTIHNAGVEASEQTRLCEVVVDAAFPQLQFADARLAGHAQEKLWTELRLQSANTELSSNLSDIEHKLNTAGGLQGGGDVASIMSLLWSVDMSLPAALVGTEQELHLLLENTGGLPAKWQIRYPTELELQIEHWADVGEPTDEELKQHMMIDTGIFSVSPKSGELAAGASMLVIVRITHLKPDAYELPLLFKVDSGKQMVFNLQGRTLAPGEGYLHLPLKTFRLGPAPVGLREPLVSTIELPNYGDTTLLFELDMSGIDELSNTNFAFPIISCPEPCGVIAPGDVARVHFAFHPLEIREYSVAVPVLFSAEGSDVGFTRTLLLQGTGHHPADAAAFNAAEAEQQSMLPPSQRLRLQELPLRLSFDRALFGRIPHGANPRQLLILENVSTSACGFEWDSNHPLWGERFSIYPSRGSVPAGKHLCCKVTFLGAGTIERVSFTVACKLLLHHPTDSQQSMLNSTVPLQQGGSPRSCSPFGTSSGSPSARRRDGAEAPKRLSVTAPRPKLRGMVALQAAEDRRQRLANSSQSAGLTSPHKAIDAEPPAACPEQPKVLMLDVRGTVLPIDILQEQEGFDLRSFYIPHDALSPEEALLGASPIPSPSRAVKLSTTPPVEIEQREALDSVLSDMLRGILSSTDVRRILERAEQPEVPWFSQLRAARGTTIPAWGQQVLPKGAYEDRMLGKDATAEEVEREQQRQVRARRDALMASAELQELASYVLEGTLFNLVSEASHGEFNISQQPRQLRQPLPSASS